MLSSCADMTSRQALTAHICIRCQQQVPPREAETPSHQKREPQMHSNLEKAKHKEGWAGVDDSGDASIGPHGGKEDLRSYHGGSGPMLSAAGARYRWRCHKRGCALCNLVLTYMLGQILQASVQEGQVLCNAPLWLCTYGDTLAKLS